MMFAGDEDCDDEITSGPIDDEDERDYDGSDVEDGPCMGAECVNPHPMHTYNECETVEMHEDHRRACEAAELIALPTDALRRRVEDMRAMLHVGEAALAARASCAHMAGNWRGDVLACNDCGANITPASVD